MKIMLPLAALAAGLLIVPTVQAQTASRTVRIADLQLDTAEGLAKFDRRIAVAARDVCAAPASFERASRKASAECQAETIAAYAPHRATLIAASQTATGVELSAR